MKKTIAILMILVLAGVGLFAALTGTNTAKTLDLYTEIKPIDVMAITTAQFSGTTLDAFEAFTDYAADYRVTASGSQTGLVAFISALSNNRGGFTLKMSASAMKNSVLGQADAYINYTVVCGDATITTTGATPTTEKIVKTIAPMTVATPYSSAISVTVLDTDNSFSNAVAGDEYRGTITFTYAAN